MEYLKDSAPRVIFLEITKKAHKRFPPGKNLQYIYSWSTALQSIPTHKNYLFERRISPWWWKSRLRPCETQLQGGCRVPWLGGLCACARCVPRSSKGSKHHLVKQRWGCTVLRPPGQTKSQAFPSGSQVFNRKVNLCFHINNEWWRTYFFVTTLSYMVHRDSQWLHQEEWVFMFMSGANSLQHNLMKVFIAINILGQNKPNFNITPNSDFSKYGLFICTNHTEASKFFLEQK